MTSLCRTLGSHSGLVGIVVIILVRDHWIMIIMVVSQYQTMRNPQVDHDHNPYQIVSPNSHGRCWHGLWASSSSRPQETPCTLAGVLIDIQTRAAQVQLQTRSPMFVYEGQSAENVGHCAGQLARWNQADKEENTL